MIFERDPVEPEPPRASVNAVYRADETETVEALLPDAQRGVPVVGSDSGEIPHVLSDAGIIVPEKDEALWGRALEQLVSDPDQRVELSKRGLERARSVYAWPEVARQHAEFFSQLLDRDI